MSTETIHPDDKCFYLYADCIPVRGAKRAVICDLGTNRMDFIPEHLFEILTEYKQQTLKQIRRAFGAKNKEVLDQYFLFLLKKKYGRWLSKEELSWFPELKQTWKSPAQIENAIIDVDEHSAHDWASILSQLSDLGCFAVQLRFFSAVSREVLNQLMEHMLKSRIASVDLLLPWQADDAPHSWANFLQAHTRVKRLFLHSHPDEADYQLHKVEQAEVVITHQEITSSDHCGFVSPQYFTINNRFFAEAQQHNTCLHGKIGIDVSGNIRNCPAMPHVYGHSSTTRLDEAIKSADFNAVGAIAKDQISICKDCEFRYVCSDCRAFLDDPYGKPLHCDYDPYTASWQTKEPAASATGS